MTPMRRTRNTVQRRAVLESVRALPGHPTALVVFGRVREEHPQLSLATVYRSLHALVERGDLVELRIGNVSRFDAGPFPHHHIVCRACGAVADVPADLPAALVSDVRKTSGFLLDEHPVQFTGICPDCRETAA
jgi:Fe2+ or Zn2+ uptake regulation protein